MPQSRGDDRIQHACAIESGAAGSGRRLDERTDQDAPPAGVLGVAGRRRRAPDAQSPPAVAPRLNAYLRSSDRAPQVARLSDSMAGTSAAARGLGRRCLVQVLVLVHFHDRTLHPICVYVHMKTKL